VRGGRRRREELAIRVLEGEGVDYIIKEGVLYRVLTILGYS
jgi:hypothetical protein